MLRANTAVPARCHTLLPHRVPYLVHFAYEVKKAQGTPDEDLQLARTRKKRHERGLK